MGGGMVRCFPGQPREQSGGERAMSWDPVPSTQARSGESTRQCVEDLDTRAAFGSGVDKRVVISSRYYREARTQS